MKIRTVLPFVYALSLLMVTVINSRACPWQLGVTFDVPSVTHDVSNPELTPNPIYGAIEFPNDNPDDQMQFNLSLTVPKHWTCIVKIDGNIVQDGDLVDVTRGQSRALEIIATPNSSEVDTESLCLSFSYKKSCGVGGGCLSFFTTGTAAAVGSDQPASNITLAPNPAGSYITAFGLNNEQSGSRYEIYSSTGAEVRNGRLPADARINTGGLPSGAYRLRLFDAAQLYFSGAFTIVH
ncbi:MAG TPA: T9SS type A sorting domain-containing protein [Candidatus Kapabacteria bacterium]|nr:T9SS type A sorting domain-containing protein [Candidatus Kapabacteria bacterium]